MHRLTFRNNIYDSDGDLSERCILMYDKESKHLIVFKDHVELKEYALEMLGMLAEITSETNSDISCDYDYAHKSSLKHYAIVRSDND